MKFKDTKYGDLSGQKYYGDINVSELGLTSLEGSPKIVNGHFFCDDNNLTSLEFAPESVSGIFNCLDNKLTSLKGAPKIKKGGDFICVGNSNEHLPREYELRKKNPKLSEDEIYSAMYELTNNEIYKK